MKFRPNPKMRGQKMWAVLRDNKIYLIRPERGKALLEREILLLDGASKHKWAVKRVHVVIP
jgi:hypothetical protein